ncbi:MAG: fimbrial assembly protein [Gammaproteobacteria bacterium]|nr:fimbrial assembly protein [Gammaproteobacteria bacterium]
MKRRIEFYQAALKPSQDPASITLLWRVGLAIVLLWVIMFAYAGFNQYQLQQQNNALQAAIWSGEADLNQLRQGLAALNSRQDDGQRMRIEQNIHARQRLLGVLQQENFVSYANTLSDLARIPWQGIALQGLTLEGKRMVLRGEAASASLVPAWILGFEQRDSLRGHRFGELEISRRPQGGLGFSLYSAEVTR